MNGCGFLMNMAMTETMSLSTSECGNEGTFFL